MSHNFVMQSHTMRRNTVPSFLSSRTADFQVKFKLFMQEEHKRNTFNMVADVYFGKKIYKPFILSLSLHACHKKTSFNPFFSYFTLAGNSEERLTDLI